MEDTRKRPNPPVEGVVVQTFVRHYQGQSQMHKNTLNNVELTAAGCDLMLSILKDIREFKLE